MATLYEDTPTPGQMTASEYFVLGFGIFLTLAIPYIIFSVFLGVIAVAVSLVLAAAFVLLFLKSGSGINYSPAVMIDDDGVSSLKNGETLNWEDIQKIELFGMHSFSSGGVYPELVILMKDRRMVKIRIKPSEGDDKKLRGIFKSKGIEVG